jgi:hypothetical protein
MRTLIAFSGGFDTTFLTYELLTKTDDEVTLVYIDSSMVPPTKINRSFMLFNPSNSSSRGLYMSQKSVSWLKENCRPFNYIVEVLKESDIAEEDTLPVYFAKYAATKINEGLYDRAGGGWNWDIWPNEAYEDWLPQHPCRIAAQRAFDKITKKGKLWWPLIDEGDNIFPKRGGNVHAIKYLPKDLQKTLIGCEIIRISDDDEIIRCEKCEKCLWRRFCENKLADGWTEDQIQDYRLYRGKTFVPGRWSPWKFWIHEEFENEKTYTNITSEEAKERLKSQKTSWQLVNVPDTDIWEGLRDFLDKPPKQKLSD